MHQTFHIHTLLHLTLVIQNLDIQITQVIQLQFLLYNLNINNIQKINYSSFKRIQNKKCLLNEQKCVLFVIPDSSDSVIELDLSGVGLKDPDKANLRLGVDIELNI